jgi:hypothetical protein
MKTNNRVWIILFCVIVLSIGLSGCSEDDDGSVDNSPPVSSDDPTSDTLPTVSSVYPPDSSTDVFINTSVSVTFSESMDSTTITTNISGTDCSGSLQLSKDENSFNSCVQMFSDPSTDTEKKKFILYPNSNLETNTVYKIKVTTDVKDSSGDSLLEEYLTSIGFTTGTEVGNGDSTTDTDSTGDTTSDTSSIWGTSKFGSGKWKP